MPHAPSSPCWSGLAGRAAGFSLTIDLYCKKRITSSNSLCSDIFWRVCTRGNRRNSAELERKNEKIIPVLPNKRVRVKVLLSLGGGRQCRRRKIDSAELSKERTHSRPK